MAHFDIPLDLPHAGRIAGRLLTLIEQHLLDLELDAPDLMDVAEELSNTLDPFVDAEENPRPREAEAVRAQAAEIGRRLVAELEAAHIAGDRLGQLVRNLFECLAMGEEGAEIALRAGEDPESLQRPV